MSKFARGARPTPRHRLCAATPFLPLAAAPPQFAMVPKQLSMWKNDVDGDCVTAEEAAAKAAFSVIGGGPELFVPDSVVLAWATLHNVVNGADLDQVLDWMATTGFVVNGVLYNDGPKSSVDYSNSSVLQAAISQGPVKIGIDADALPSTAGTMQGWYAFGGSPGQFASEDHCTGLWGYGTAAYCFGQLGVPVPSGVDPNKSDCYLEFTWSSIGVVDYPWIMSTVGEAWSRSPTTVLPSPTPGPGPTPTPGPAPTPTPTPTIVQKVDAFFTALEAKYTSDPFMVKLLQRVNTMLDEWLSTTGRFKVGGTIPPSVIVIVNALFAEAAILYPQYAALLGEVQSVVVSLLTSL
jgi:hypothetical protein